jgi:hypothetical protein
MRAGQQVQATTFQPSKTQHVVPRRDNEKGGEAHVAFERRAERDEDGEEGEKAELRMPGSFEFEDTTPVLSVRATSIDSMRSACLGTCGGGCR